MKAVPQLLPPNQLEHFYRGGRRIAALRGGSASPGMSSPEEWLASMTTMSSSDTRGLSRLGDGSLLRDAVEADPEGWLGPAHLARFGPSSELLVKLLDADQRLPVHLHPDRAFARRHLSAGHGKTEAWYVLSADPGAAVRLGFTEPVTADRLRRLVADRDTDALVGALHRLTVAPGDAVLVPAGTPHCIDPGIFVLELQEPTDFSILLEARDLPLDLDRDGHLGLGYDVALEAVHREALSRGALAELVRRGRQTGDLMPPGAAEFFRLHSGRDVTYEPGFAVVVVIDGRGRFVAADAPSFDVRRGDAVVVPFAAGTWRIDGDRAGAREPAAAAMTAVLRRRRRRHHADQGGRHRRRWSRAARRRAAYAVAGRGRRDRPRRVGHGRRHGRRAGGRRRTGGRRSG